MNQVMRQFAFPSRRCEDGVADHPSWAKFFLSFDLDREYWQVELDAETRDRTTFFILIGGKHWAVMPMGSHFHLSNQLCSSTPYPTYLQVAEMTGSLFDMVYLNIWPPGEMPDKYDNAKVFTSIDCMTWLAIATFLSQGDIDARIIADAALTVFFRRRRPLASRNRR
jgi:hypothetical protein